MHAKDLCMQSSIYMYMAGECLKALYMDGIWEMGPPTGTGTSP